MAERQRNRGEKEKPKDTKKTLARLWQYLRLYKGRFICAVLLTMFSNGLALVAPMLSGEAINAISEKAGVDFPKVYYYAALIILLNLASGILSYILTLIMIGISQSAVRKMRNDVFGKLMELPVGYFDRNFSGDIISRISYDIDVINASLSNDVVQISASVITVVGSLVMMIIISPILVLVMLLMIPVSIFCTSALARRNRPLFSKRSAKIGELNGFVEEMVTGWKTIQAYAVEDVMLERFDKINTETVDAYFNADYYGTMVGPTVNFISNLSLAFVTAFGAILLFFGRLRIGNISSFVLYSRKFSGPINEAANIVNELQSALAAAERVFKVLNEDIETQDVENAVVLSDVKGNVRIEDVDFGYTKERQVIKGLNLFAQTGSLTAIVGSTGAGKTTIINLLMRFYDPDSGRIYVDEYENREITRQSLRKSYVMVLQDTWVFGGSIYDNIAYGKEGATMEEVVGAAKAARIHSYIRQLPQGYHTILTADGMNISKGQKQLLTIARAMLLDAKMLILDEATSNVDTRTEIMIQKAMRKLMANKTCFVIAHRLSTIQNADLILVIENGNVIEQGNHEALMAGRGHYYRMYASQYE